LKQLADGVYQLSGFPPNAMNVCFGHGPPLRDGPGLRESTARLAT
jgi:hypothetical protein